MVRFANLAFSLFIISKSVMDSSPTDSIARPGQRQEETCMTIRTSTPSAQQGIVLTAREVNELTRNAWRIK